MNKKTGLILVAVVVFLVLAVVLVAQSATPLQLLEATPTATPFPTVTPTQPPPSASHNATPSPTAKQNAPPETPSASPAQAVRINSVSIDNATAASVTASSQTGGDILITEIILKDTSGKTLAIDDSIHQTLPADGSPVKITINQNNVRFSLGGTFTLTIVTSYGAGYTSQSTYPPFY